MCEAAELQVDQHETAQAPMVEDKVHTIPLVADAQAPLAADEAEVASKLQQKGFEVINERGFQFGLGIFVAQIKEFEDVRILNFLLGRSGVAGQRTNAFDEHRRLVSGQRRALVELGLDLAVELTHRPAVAQAFRFVECPGILVLHRQEAHVSRPRQRKARPDPGEKFCRQCLKFC